MKRSMMFVVAAQVVVTLHADFVQERVLDAIAKVETGAKRSVPFRDGVQKEDTTIGPDGEISRYQFMPYVLNEAELEDRPKDVNSTSHVYWANGVAKRVLNERITRFYSLNHRMPTDREIYILWHRPSYLIYQKRFVKENPIPAIVEKRAAKFVEVLNAR